MLRVLSPCPPDPRRDPRAKKPPGGKHRAAPCCLRGDEELRQRWLQQTMVRRRIPARYSSRTVPQSGPTHRPAAKLRPRYGDWVAPASSPASTQLRVISQEPLAPLPAAPFVSLWFRL